MFYGQINNLSRTDFGARFRKARGWSRDGRRLLNWNDRWRQEETDGKTEIQRKRVEIDKCLWGQWKRSREEKTSKDEEEKLENAKTEADWGRQRDRKIHKTIKQEREREGEREQSGKTAREGVRLLGNLRYEERRHRQKNQWTCLCEREWSPGSMPSKPQPGTQ